MFNTVLIIVFLQSSFLPFSQSYPLFFLPQLSFFLTLCHFNFLSPIFSTSFIFSPLSLCFHFLLFFILFSLSCFSLFIPKLFCFFLYFLYFSLPPTHTDILYVLFPSFPDFHPLHLFLTTLLPYISYFQFFSFPTFPHFPLFLPKFTSSPSIFFFPRLPLFFSPFNFYIFHLLLIFTCFLPP